MVTAFERDEAFAVFSFWIRRCVLDEHLPIGDLMQIVSKYYWTLADEIAYLKRKISMTGIDQEEMSLLSTLWENDGMHVTIQSVSQFMQRLPAKFKMKIWEHHCSGDYIANFNILNTLYSFVALYIKIRKPQRLAHFRTDIELNLVPFADVVRQRTVNAKGMTLLEFNEEFHFWILDPVSGFVKTEDKPSRWIKEVDFLREQLAKAQQRKLQIQRTIKLRRMMRRYLYNDCSIGHHDLCSDLGIVRTTGRK